MLPITTTSEEARYLFVQGRELAFHWQGLQAHEPLDAAIALDSGFVLAHLHRAGTSHPFQRGFHFERAEAHLDRVTAGERRLLDAFRAFLVDGAFDQAIEILNGLASEYPDDPRLPAYLGMRYYNHRADFEEAGRQFVRALERDPGFVPGYNLVGCAALARGDLATAEVHLREYVHRAPDHWRPYYSLALLLEMQGLPDRAAESFHDAFRRDPSGDARNRLGIERLGAGHLEEAEHLFRENLRLHPDEPDFHHSLGEMCLGAGRLDEAVSHFERVLALDAGFEPSREKLAHARAEAASGRA